MGVSRVFWDTNVFIYFFEAQDKLGPVARGLRETMIKRGDQLVTSAMTLGEILVKPRQQGDLTLCRKIEETLKAISVVMSFDIEAARHYSELRQHRSLKAPDAVQLACAAAAKVDLFITNDNRLQSLHVPGIQFIVPIDRVPL
jgi:predicted nucleic acid-binding protein